MFIKSNQINYLLIVYDKCIHTYMKKQEKNEQYSYKSSIQLQSYKS